MLLGSAVLTLAVGLAGHRWPAKSLLLAACGLMAATGVGFSAVHAFWPLALVGFVGTLNPSNGDVSPSCRDGAVAAGFHAGPASRRTGLFARYGLAGLADGRVLGGSQRWTAGALAARRPPSPSCS